MPLAHLDYRRQRMAHWDEVARLTVRRPGFGGYYHRRLVQIYTQTIAPGQRVLELGCGRGDLLAALKPSFGVGIDFSHEMVTAARSRHPHLHFVEADVHTMPIDATFDVIVLADLINDLWDVQTVLERLRPLCTPRTRIVMNFFSKLWELPLRAARRMGLAAPVLEQNWLARDDVLNLLHLAGLEPIHQWQDVLWPIRTPVIDTFANRFLAKLPLVRHGSLTNLLVARAVPETLATPAPSSPPRVSVIVPARNEAGNVPAIFARVPEMGGGTELIFVEGGSKDDTYAAIERAIAENPGRCAKLLRQTGVGKGDAVRLGFAESTGDMLMILDADLTVPPEDLPRFYEALRNRRGELVNGVRLVYPMEKRSMRFLNLLGNKFFGVAFSWVLAQPVKDTLCGTKALRREDYDLIAANRSYFGDFDPFGDFDLLFGAARLNLKIQDLPIRYRERTYGATNIHRFRHGLLLFRMLGLAAARLKFT
jgi:SAM-dependent methyltransferase